MNNTLIFIWHLLIAFVKLCAPNGYRKLVAENVALRQQLVVVSRSHKRAPKLTSTDRFLFGLCSLWMTKRRIIKNAIIIKPSTIINFHRALVKKKYHVIFSSRYTGQKTGPKGPSQEIIQAVVAMKQKNSRFGYARIAQQISLAFGIELNKDVVRRILAKHYDPPLNNSGPSWLTFLGHSKDSLWSIDFFRCESIHLKSHWVMVVMDQFTRRLIGFAVHSGNLDGIAACQMLNRIIADQPCPQRLSSDNDPLFQFHRWKANLRIRGIEEIKSIPCMPTSHPFVERLIGTVRRELLDQTLFWTASDLEQKLGDFKAYYNHHRTHTGQKGNTPIPHQKKPLSLKRYAWQKHCRGLFSLPVSV